MLVDGIMLFTLASIAIVWYFAAQALPIIRDEIIEESRLPSGERWWNRPELSYVERRFHESEGPAIVAQTDPYPGWIPSESAARAHQRLAEQNRQAYERELRPTA